MTPDDVYHDGELVVQAKSGVQRQARMNAGAIQDHVPAGATHFISQQVMAVIGSLDAGGNVWASLLFGKPGFLQAENTRSLRLQRQACHTGAGDPLWNNLDRDPRLGMLLIELTSRRRLRINGRARRDDNGDYLIQVERAYANCPKYIQARQLQTTGDKHTASMDDFTYGVQLSLDQCEWISKADTLFVASAHPEQGCDASHRGGRPGFVEVLDPRHLRIPDFAGNGMFNTLGNFISYPRAGLVFPDFESNRVLQLTGRASVLWADSDERAETTGLSRYWEFALERWHESTIPIPLRWHFLDYSTFLPPVRKTDMAKFSLCLAKAWYETDRVKVFELVAASGDPLPRFEPGAHLPLRVCDASGNRVERHYSLISDPADRHHYRIAVQAVPGGRGGSLYMHRELQAGDKIQASAPVNAFALRKDATHSILIAGGIGITPLFSMACALHAADRSFELHYTAKRFAELAFRRDIEQRFGDRVCFYASRDTEATRLDLKPVLENPVDGHHIYVCGPRSLILAVREIAESAGWLPEQVHFESFGAETAMTARAITVRLARSDRKYLVPADKSILDVLLEAGIDVPHDCKRGECSLCKTRVLAGQPDHRDLCLHADERNESMCVCVSRTRTDYLTLDL